MKVLIHKPTNFTVNTDYLETLDIEDSYNSGQIDTRASGYANAISALNRAIRSNDRADMDLWLPRVARWKYLLRQSMLYLAIDRKVAYA